MSSNVRTVETRFVVNDSQHNNSIKGISQQYKLLGEQVKTIDSTMANQGRTLQNLELKEKAYSAQLKTNSDLQVKYGEGLKRAKERAEEYRTTVDRLGEEKKELKARIKEEIKAHGENSDVVKKSKEELAQLERKQSDYSEQVRKAERDVDKYSTEIEKLRQNDQKLAGALEKTRKEIERKSDALHQAGINAQKYGKKMQDVGDKITKFGTGASMYLTAPIAAAGAAAIKASIDFESAFTGVKKTVDEADVPGGYAAIRESILDLGDVLPATHEEIAGVVEIAGQLGIEGESLMSFSKVMIDLGETTNIAASEAGESLARFANITGMSQKDFDKLGATIVDLGNNFATSESEIVNMGMRLSAAGSQVGLTEPQIMALATTLSSVGLEAEAGGSAFSKLMIRIKSATVNGNADLGRFAKVSGMTAAEFKQAFETDAAGALIAFMKGIDATNESGDGALATLEDLNIKEIRLRDATLRTASGYQVLENALGLADEAWKNNTALVKEAELRYGTTESKIAMAKNEMRRVAIEIGDKLAPTFLELVEGLSDLVQKFTELDPKTQMFLIKTAGLTAAIGPLAVGLGSTVKGVGHLVEGYGKLAVKSAELSKSSGGVAKVVGGALNPTLALATIAIGGIAAALWLAMEPQRRHTEHVNNAIDAIGGFKDAVASAEPLVTNFADAGGRLNRSIEKNAQKLEGYETSLTRMFEKNTRGREEMTRDEMNTINEYTDLLGKHVTKVIEQYSARLDVAQTSLSKETDLSLESAARNIKTALEYDKQLAEVSQKSYDDKMNVVAEGIVREKKLRKEGNIAAAEAQRRFNEELMELAEKAKEEEAKIVNARTVLYLQETMNKFKEGNKEELEGLKGLSEVQSQHTKIMNDFADRRKQINEDTTMSEREKTRKLERLYSEQVKALRDNKLEENWVWDENTEKVAGALLDQVAAISLYGGEIDAETANMVNAIMGSLARTPEGADKVREMLQGSIDAIVAGQPELEGAADQMAKNLDVIMQGIAEGKFETGQQIIAELMRGIVSANDDIEGAMSEVDRAVNEHLSMMNRNIAEKAEETVQELEKPILTLEEFSDRLGKEPEKVAEALAKMSGQFNMSNEDLMYAIEAWGGSFDDFAAEHQATIDKISESINSYVEITTNGFQKIEQNSTVGLKTYMKNMEKNQEATRNWVDNTKKLMKAGVSEGIIQELAKMGPAGAEQAERWVKQLEKMNGGSLTEYEKLNKKTKTFLDEFGNVYTNGLVEANEAAELQHEANDYGGQGAYMIGQFIAGMIAELPYMKEMAEQMGYKNGVWTENGIIESEPRVRQAAEATRNGIIHSLDGMQYESKEIAVKAVREMEKGIVDKTPATGKAADLLRRKINTELEQLPFETRKVSKDAIEYMALTIEAVQPVTTRAAKRVRTGIQSEIDPLKRYGVSSGKNLPSGVADGIYAHTYLAERAARWLARKTRTAFDQRLEIRSPSRVMMKSGKHITEGIALGIQQEAELVEKSMNKLAQIPIMDSFTSNPKFEKTNRNINELRQTVDVNINVNGSKNLENDHDFMGKIKTVILNEIQTGNRAIPNRTSLIPL